MLVKACRNRIYYMFVFFLRRRFLAARIALAGLLAENPGE